MMLQHPLPATVTALTPAHRALGAASRINEKNNIKTDCSPRVEHMYVKAVPSNRLHVHIIMIITLSGIITLSFTRYYTCTCITWIPVKLLSLRQLKTKGVVLKGRVGAFRNSMTVNNGVEQNADIAKRIFNQAAFSQTRSKTSLWNICAMYKIDQNSADVTQERALRSDLYAMLFELCESHRGHISAKTELT